MRLLEKVKDGGPTSPVDAYFLLEIKNLFSVAVLKFNSGGREAFHTHAFNAITWFIKGELIEEDVDGKFYTYIRKLIPKVTRREKNHRVSSIGDSWCLTIRGPWCKTWKEVNKETKEITTFTNGRKILDVSPYRC